ncbi:MAG: anti-sigma factor family protein [Planctomycetota bacterium]|jgi:hypothetical protein
MSCAFDDELLSGYLDDELDDEIRIAVRNHLDRCDECSSRLRAMAALRDRVAASRRVELPERLWSRIEATRRAAGAAEAVSPPGRSSPVLRRLRPWIVAAAAAIVVVALPLIWTLGRAGVRGEEEVGVDRFEAPPGIALAKYVEEIRAGDEEAAGFLGMHRGRRIPLDEMAEHASFRPWLPTDLPAGFRVETCYVLSTGCGNALRLDCVRENQRLTIFQQPVEGPVLLEGELQGCLDLSGVHFRCFVVQDCTVLNWSGEACSLIVVCPPGATDVESTICSLMQEQLEHEQEPEQETDP